MADLTINGDTKIPMKTVYVAGAILVAIALAWAALSNKADAVKQELTPMREDLADMKVILQSIDERMRNDVLRFEARITALEVQLRAAQK